MTMVAEPAPATTVGVVVMTRDEARACVDRIKGHCEGISTALAELHDREGWKALGYQTWNDCIKGEFNTSKQRAHQLLNLHTVSRIIGVEPRERSTMLTRTEERDGLPESHARALTPLVGDPDTLRAVHAEVQAQTNGHPKASDYTRVVERVKPKSERRSVSSASDRNDSQDVPDELILGPSTDPGDLGVRDEWADVSNNEAGPGAGRSLFCSQCGTGDHRTEACPDSTAQPAPSQDDDAPYDPYDHDTPFDLKQPHPDGVSPPIQLNPDDFDRDVDAPADGPGDAEVNDAVASPSIAASGAEVGDFDAASAPPAAPDPDDDLSDEYPNLTAALAKERASSHPSQEQDRPVSDDRTEGHKSGSKGTTVSAARVFSAARPLDAGDLSRVLLDLPTDQVVEAIAENATPSQRAALRQALGSPGRAAPAEETTPDLRAALVGRTVLEMADALAETVTSDALPSLLAVLADKTPAERLGPLAHRLAVRVKNTGDLIDPEPIAVAGPRKPAEIAAEAAGLTPGLRRSVISQIAETLESDDLEKLEAVFSARRGYLATVRLTVGR